MTANRKKSAVARKRSSGRETNFDAPQGHAQKIGLPSSVLRSMSVDFEPPQNSRVMPTGSQQALASNFIFMDLSDEQRNLFIDAMQMETVKEKRRLFKQGDNGDSLHLQAGKVTLWTAMKT
jgi:hypothetical protein